MSNAEVISHLKSSILQNSQITEFFQDAVALLRQQNTSTNPAQTARIEVLSLFILLTQIVEAWSCIQTKHEANLNCNCILKSMGRTKWVQRVVTSGTGSKPPWPFTGKVVTIINRWMEVEKFLFFRYVCIVLFNFLTLVFYSWELNDLLGLLGKTV